MPPICSGRTAADRKKRQDVRSRLICTRICYFILIMATRMTMNLRRSWEQIICPPPPPFAKRNTILSTNCRIFVFWVGECFELENYYKYSGKTARLPPTTCFITTSNPYSPKCLSRLYLALNDVHKFGPKLLGTVLHTLKFPTTLAVRIIEMNEARVIWLQSQFLRRAFSQPQSL